MLDNAFVLIEGHPARGAATRSTPDARTPSRESIQSDKSPTLKNQRMGHPTLPPARTGCATLPMDRVRIVLIPRIGYIPGSLAEYPYTNAERASRAKVGKPTRRLRPSL